MKKTTIKLADMNCSQLADWLETAAEPNESKTCMRLRHMCDLVSRERLRSTPNRNARRWRAIIKAVGVVLNAPVVKLIIGGGRPRLEGGVKFTKLAKDIAAERGLVLHRWTGGYAIYARKEEGPPLAKIAEESMRQPSLIG